MDCSRALPVGQLCSVQARWPHGGATVNDGLIYDWNREGRLPKPPIILLNDETLRDGLQSPSVRAPSIGQKLRILHLLDRIGIDTADIGLPGAGPHVVKDVERLAREIAAAPLKLQANCAARTVVADIEQEAFSEYHLYTLGRRTTINNAETKQVSMLGATGVPVQKRYVVDGQAFYYHNAQHPGAPIKDDVQVYYQFRNEQKTGLGVPMPAGIVRVYQSDSKGGTHFIGEDRIDHTPTDETLNLRIGNAFDVVCERKQVDFQKIGSGVYEMEFEITLRNHKTAPVTVEVNEPIGGTWRMLSASHEWAKTAAWASQFKVPVAVGGTSVLKYRVRVNY